MTDDSPFAAFVPSSPEVSAPAEAKNKTRKTRKARKKVAAKATQSAAPAVAPVAASTPTKTKKERKPRTKKVRPVTVDITKAFVAMAGMKDSDCEVLEQLTHLLAAQPKASRKRLATALAKIFA